VLEALSLPYSSMVESDPEYLVKKWEDNFFVRYSLASQQVSLWYESQKKRKKYMIEKKSTTRKKIAEIYPCVVSFHPMKMNLMYLWPSNRRDFLDETLSQTHHEYRDILAAYKKVLRARNAILKRIHDWSSTHEEIEFWDEKYVKWASLIYSYRYKLIQYFQDNIDEVKKYFFWKIESAQFRYISKTRLESAENDLREYIKNNKKKEILLQKTLRGPHLDDFDIEVDGISLVHFASRWEVKSCVLWLMFLETQFISHQWRSEDILFLIDDILSELDSKHRDLIWEYIWESQCIITCIEDINVTWNKIFL